MPYVTGAQILTAVEKTSPTADDTAWAGKVADGIEAAIAALMDGNTPSAGGVDELEVAALLDGAATFNSRKAPHGIQSLGPDGDAIRLGADTIRVIRKIIQRVHPTAGIGIG